MVREKCSDRRGS